MTAMVLAVVATLVALGLAGVAAGACWWGCAQRRTARRAMRQLDVCVSWLAHDMEAIVGEGR